MAKAKKKEISRFPRNLYKKGGDLVWGKKENTYSTVLVENEEEFKAALKAGYLDDFSAAIFGEEEVTESVDLDEDF